MKSPPAALESLAGGEKGNTTMMTATELSDAVAGRTRWTWLKKPMPFQLNGAEMAEFERAKTNGFYISRRRPNLSNAYWEYCKIENLPYVRIDRRRLYATVRLDMWPCLFNLSTVGVERMKELIWHYGSRPFDFELGYHCCGCERVFSTLAEQMAQQMWEVATTEECRVPYTERGPDEFISKLITGR